MGDGGWAIDFGVVNCIILYHKMEDVAKEVGVRWKRPNLHITQHTYSTLPDGVNNNKYRLTWMKDTLWGWKQPKRKKGEEEVW